MMNPYRKKPVVITAQQHDGSYESARELAEICGGTVEVIDIHRHGYFDYIVKITTLEGVMICGASDWMIRGVKGEYYPCKADIFSATYDEEPTP